VDRRQLDATRRFTQRARVALVVFQAAVPDTQGAHQRRGDDADIMAQLLRLGGHAERLRAGLHDDAGPRAARQSGYESVRPTPQLFDDVTRAVSDADLTLAAPQIDANMLHDPSSPVPILRTADGGSHVILSKVKLSE
jgi:hypothetical protein